MVISRHYEIDRQKRNEIVHTIGEGTPVVEFKVDRGHKNGPELHVITNTGLIKIYNFRTHKLVTVLIARPNQIRRLYAPNEAPQYLIDIAREHRRLRYNEI